jgi:hypothetical protein
MLNVMTVNSCAPIAAADEDGTTQSKTALAMAPPMSFLNLGPNLMQAGELRDRRHYLVHHLAHWPSQCRERAGVSARLLPQPHGFEGLLTGGKPDDADHPAVTDRPDASSIGSRLGSAGPPTRSAGDDRDHAVARVD